MTSDLAAISAATDLAELAREHGLKLRRQPNGWTTECIFHVDKTASLRIHTAGKHKGKFKCFGCGAHGDVFDWTRQVLSCDLPTAIRTLAADAGITVYDKPETPAERRQREADRMEKEICQWYFRQEWQKARRGLNRATSAWERGNQFADDIATIYGTRLRWIESERGTALGLAEFRASGTTERHYREWLSGHLARYAARLDFVALVLENRMVG